MLLDWSETLVEKVLYYQWLCCYCLPYSTECLAITGKEHYANMLFCLVMRLPVLKFLVFCCWKSSMFGQKRCYYILLCQMQTDWQNYFTGEVAVTFSNLTAYRTRRYTTLWNTFVTKPNVLQVPSYIGLGNKWRLGVSLQCVGQANKVHETTTFLLLTSSNIHLI